MKTKSEKRNHRMALAFALPAAIFSMLLIIYPLFTTVKLSFQNVKFIGSLTDDPGLTLENYTKLCSNTDFWNALGRSVLFTFLALSLSFLIGLGLALLLNKKFRFQKCVRTLILLAWPIPGVIVGLLFTWLFDANYGIINMILKSMHLIDRNVKWITMGNTAKITVITATIWKSYPFFTLTLLAGLKGISSDYYEAASIDGANGWQRFVNITLPALKSVIVTSLLLNGLWIFRNYDLVYTITGGGPNQATETLPLLLYNQAFKYYNMGYASAVGMVSLLVCSVFVILAMPSLKKQFY
ncbi:MAG: sugar ABC transporter permease [Ruminococcus sp.]|jgi:multiple sugar transport system permease protein|uniref:Sugar ABC transporter permease n=1 Tax=Schaedlerella arabinosiphila TaxID=2044587 RepID=A0A3R8M2Z4_9FIRM|nr:sugar ABC transporter permease [Schaedlerella arabinosiphila]MCI8722517.1 sugar ABC transporter permease [Ruminococcus sp.]RRK34879.1 sugar ABC transporter permease [Schaedlerella arabinosiphila]